MDNHNSPFNFEAQLAIGEEEEGELDRYFCRWHEIDPIPANLQRLGMGDRIFTCRKTGIRFAVEYKADSKAAKTQNAFVETVSVDVKDTPGWAKSSLAQVLIYYIPPQRIAYIFHMPAFKEALRGWIGNYPERGARNEQYNTLGLLVPLSIVTKFSVRTIKITGG